MLGPLTLLALACSVCRCASAARGDSPAACGGRLAGPHGVIRTPHFPAAFPVPLRCTWIISHEIENGTISVYFTQQYVTSGLTFTEYTYYDDSYKLGERRAFTVTEENITKVKYIQVTSPVLVVELRVAALEGSQLRALGLLAVFGLNVTYAVRPPPPRRGTAPATPDAAPAASDAVPAVTAAPATLAAPDSCSALDCRLLGDCKVTSDYQKFYCDCYPGYSGADCGEGPLCARAENRCKHGGVCRQMGPAAVSCICPPGYTGDLCESHIASPECDITECSEGCTHQTPCDCSPKEVDSTSARYEIRLFVMDQANKDISQEILKQLSKHLKALNISVEDEITVLNVSAPDSSGARTMRLRIWGARRGASALRAALARMSPARMRVDHFQVHPALSLQTLTLNQRTEVWEGSEFLLSCTALGSAEIRFSWYKDGVRIDFSASLRDMWTRTVAEDALGRRISVLGVSSARAQDGGRWSCAADDAGRRRCRALHLTVLRPPGVRLLPSTITVNKGDNVSITCLAGAGRQHGALGFSWARERTLLPLAPGREVWEDLYPAGSVLKLYNVQKSGEFRCQVSSVAGTSSKGVRLWALASTDIACEAGSAFGLHWTRTAPGAYAGASCPPGHSGETTRFCEPKTMQRAVKWRNPDFSACLADSLKLLYHQYIRISYGFLREDLANIIRQYGDVLHSLPMHPGLGTIPLQHVREMVDYLNSAASTERHRMESVPRLLKIFDLLLKYPDAFLDEENTYDLQTALLETAAMKDYLEVFFQEFSVMTKPVQDDNAAHFKLHPGSSKNREWSIAAATVELVEDSANNSIVAVLYKNLAARLPSLRSSIELFNGRATEYHLSSQQIQFSGRAIDINLQHKVTLYFTHIYNYTAIVSKLACGLRSSSEPRVWSTKSCEIQIPEPTLVACHCRGLGTYALFTIAKSTLTDTEKDLRGVVRVAVGVGGSLCLLAAALQLLGLVPSRRAKMPVLLKATTAGTHSAAMLALLECDTRQEEACSGALGWVCAACWCCGCAALCAQPLLLQGELAGRTSHASSVGLLAGVCILAWLTARLWGGAPLQLGTAAQVVCAAACGLLIVLCLGLAVCATLRLRTITHKISTDRKTFIQSRRKVIRHTLLLLVSTTAAQAAGVAYAQPGERHTAHVVLIAAAAIVNGIAMVVCYVIRDDECLRAAGRALSLAPQRHWDHEKNDGDTSLSLYIKQSGEVESRGGVGVLESSMSQLSPITSYWRAPDLESPARMNRRQSLPDCRADIVRCVEYVECALRPSPAPRMPPCDLVPPADICTCSAPPPIKSCLKKPHHSSTTSLPGEHKPRIDHVNREWNKTYGEPDTEKVLNKISSDLDFLLNKTKADLDKIEEAPS